MLGWNRRFGNTHVCGESDDGLGGCAIDVSYANALAHCTNQGARLCTPKELGNDVARSTGCGFDTRLVWTSESCMLAPGMYGKIVAGGSSKYDGTIDCYLKRDAPTPASGDAQKKGDTSSTTTTTTVSTGADKPLVAQGRCCADFDWQKPGYDFTGIYPSNDYGEDGDGDNTTRSPQDEASKETSDGIYVFVILLFVVVAIAAGVHFYRNEKARKKRHTAAAVAGNVAASSVKAAAAARVPEHVLLSAPVASPHSASYAPDGKLVLVPRKLQFKPSKKANNPSIFSMKSDGEGTRFVHTASQMFHGFNKPLRGSDVSLPESPLPGSGSSLGSLKYQT